MLFSFLQSSTVDTILLLYIGHDFFDHFDSISGLLHTLVSLPSQSFYYRM